MSIEIRTGNLLDADIGRSRRKGDDHTTIGGRCCTKDNASGERSSDEGECFESSEHCLRGVKGEEWSRMTCQVRLVDGECLPSMMGFYTDDVPVLPI